MSLGFGNGESIGFTGVRFARLMIDDASAGLR